MCAYSVGGFSCIIAHGSEACEWLDFLGQAAVSFLRSFAWTIWRVFFLRSLCGTGIDVNPINAEATFVQRITTQIFLKPI